MYSQRFITKDYFRNISTRYIICLIAFKFLKSGVCYCPFIPGKLLE